jgi:hypothetical protein
MSKRHYFFLLDHMVVALKPDFRDGVTETTLECGLEPHADDMEVIDLASRRHAILVTVDVKIIKKCRDFQDRSSRQCLYGLLMLPDGILIQRRILEEIKTSVKQMRHPHYDRPLTWADIHDDNLLVKAHKDGDPDVEELCNSLED